VGFWRKKRFEGSSGDMKGGLGVISRRVNEDLKSSK